MSDKPIGSCSVSCEQEVGGRTSVYGMIRKEEDYVPPFFAFSGADYYPRGGAEDLQSVHETLEDAENAVVNSRPDYDLCLDWGHVMDGRGLRVSELEIIE